MDATVGLILFGHGARDAQWAEPMRRLQAMLKAMRGDLRVELAFMEFMQPSLDEAADRLVAGGVRRLSVVPVFLAQGGHLKRDVPELVARLRARHPQLDCELLTAVGEDEGVLAAMAAYALRSLDPV